MFEVQRKKDKKIFEVYSVKNNKVGYPNFLIYEDNQWKWKSAKLFHPINEWNAKRLL